MSMLCVNCGETRTTPMRIVRRKKISSFSERGRARMTKLLGGVALPRIQPGRRGGPRWLNTGH